MRRYVYDVSGDARGNAFLLRGSENLLFDTGMAWCGRRMVEPTKAHFYPVGLDIFMQYNAPANWIETANTYGNEFYARMDVKPKGRGYDLEVQSNPLALCAYPEALVELTGSYGEVVEK